MKRMLFAAAIAIFTVSSAHGFETARYIAEQTGIDHAYEGGWEFFVGGGVATFDCDGDGREDLYLAGGDKPAGLYRNVSTVGGAMKFVKLADGALSLKNVTGAYPLDIDGDGQLDLAVLRVGENKLFRGLGGCRFEATNTAWNFDGGVDWTTAFTARWDKGEDWPTLFFGNYVDRAAPGSPFGTCATNQLWRPQTGGGFGHAQALQPSYCTLSALFSDWNRNGVADLRLTNDRQYYRGGQDQLWQVAATGEPSLYGRKDGWRKLSIWGMGIASHDVTGDGYPDYVLASMGDNKLRTLSKGPTRPVYGDEAGKRGMTSHRPYVGGDILPSTGWHPEFKDVNNDGFVDLFISKGNVEAMKDFAAKDPNSLLMGQADGSFTQVGETAGIVTYAKARGASLADFNLDGLPDLVVVNRNAPVEVWRNVGLGTAARPVAMGNWLQLKLLQDGGNRNAVGAWIEVRIGNRTLTREVTVGGGHASGHHGWLHFGVGTAERARVRVRWPDGEWGPWVRVYTNQFARVVRGAAQAQPWLPPGQQTGLLTDLPPG